MAKRVETEAIVVDGRGIYNYSIDARSADSKAVAYRRMSSSRIFRGVALPPVNCSTVAVRNVVARTYCETSRVVACLRLRSLVALGNCLVVM